MRMLMSKFMRISADADPDAELRYTSKLHAHLCFDKHLLLLDCVVSQVGWLSGGSVSCDLWHRCKVASLSVFFKIDSLVDHPVCGLLCVVCMCWGDQPVEPWLLTLDLLRCLGLELCSFHALLFCLVTCVRLWNGLHESVFAGEGLGAFKTSLHRFLLQGWLPAVSSFSSTISLSFFLFLGPKIAWGSLDLQALCLYSCCFWSCPCLPLGWFSR